MARFVGRDNVRKQLAPLEGEPGRTSYADGIVRIEHAEEILLVRPPFGLAHEGQYDVVRLAPLFDALAEDHVVGALLVRLAAMQSGSSKANSWLPRRSDRASSRVATRRAAPPPIAFAGAAKVRRRR